MIIALCIAGYIGIGVTTVLLYCLVDTRKNKTTIDRYFEDADNKTAALIVALLWPIVAFMVAILGVLQGALWILKFALKEIRKEK